MMGSKEPYPEKAQVRFHTDYKRADDQQQCWESDLQVSVLKCTSRDTGIVFMKGCVALHTGLGSNKLQVIRLL